MSNLKDTNPKDALGIRKVPFSTIPMRVLWRVGLAMLEGALKYGRSNYRVSGVRASVYFDAAFARHGVGWWEGQDIDPESQLHHLDKLIASFIVLRDGILTGNWVDDRPPVTCDVSAEMQDLNDHVAWLLQKYPQPVEPYTQAELDKMPDIPFDEKGPTQCEELFYGDNSPPMRSVVDWEKEDLKAREHALDAVGESIKRVNAMRPHVRHATDLPAGAHIRGSSREVSEQREIPGVKSVSGEFDVVTPQPKAPLDTPSDGS